MMKKRPSGPPPNPGSMPPRFNRNRRPQREHRINDEITEPQVRLITDDGAQLVDTPVALARAQEQGVDLVEIAKGQEAPIVRIIDYGKFKFEKAKKDKENKKRQKVIQIKEIKMGPKIDTGDFDRKAHDAREFLDEGDNVKVTMKFRGREMQHTEIGLEKLNAFFEKLTDCGILEKKPSLEGRMMSMVIRPKGKPGGQAKPASSEEPVLQ